MLLQPSEGHINVCGFDTRDEAHIWNIRQHVGMVFQNPDNQIVATMVEEDVAFGPENIQVPTARTGKRREGEQGRSSMTRYKHKSPLKLSGGEKTQSLGQLIM